MEDLLPDPDGTIPEPPGTDVAINGDRVLVAVPAAALVFVSLRTGEVPTACAE